MIWDIIGVILYSCAMVMSALSIVLFKLQRVKPGHKWNWTHVAWALQVTGGLISIIPMTVLPLNILAMMAISTIIISAILSRFILNKTYSMRRYMALLWISVAISFSIYFANFSDPPGRVIYNSMREHHKRAYLMTITSLMWFGSFLTMHIPPTRTTYKVLAPLTLALIYACNDMNTKFAGDLSSAYFGANLMTIITIFVWIYVIGVAVFSLYFAKIVFENTVVVNSVLIQSLAHITFSNMNAFAIFDARVNYVLGYLICVAVIFTNLVIYFQSEDPAMQYGDKKEDRCPVADLECGVLQSGGGTLPIDYGSVSVTGGMTLPPETA